jgi:hypothetical protein
MDLITNIYSIVYPGWDYPNVRSWDPRYDPCNYNCCLLCGPINKCAYDRSCKRSMGYQLEGKYPAPLVYNYLRSI